MTSHAAHSRIAALLELLGSVAIGLAAAVCSGIAHLRDNPIAIATVVVCGCVLFPLCLLHGQHLQQAQQMHAKTEPTMIRMKPIKAI